MSSLGVSQATIHLRQWLIPHLYSSRRGLELEEKETFLESQEIPKGFMAVYVGKQKQRYAIPTNYLSMLQFRALMDKAGEEFGYDQEGGLQLPCEEHDFEDILLRCMRISKTKSKSLKLY